MEFDKSELSDKIEIWKAEDLSKEFEKELPRNIIDRVMQSVDGVVTNEEVKSAIRGALEGNIDTKLGSLVEEISKYVTNGTDAKNLVLQMVNTLVGNIVTEIETLKKELRKLKMVYENYRKIVGNLNSYTYRFVVGVINFYTTYEKVINWILEQNGEDIVLNMSFKELLKFKLNLERFKTQLHDTTVTIMYKTIDELGEFVRYKPVSREIVFKVPVPYIDKMGFIRERYSIISFLTDEFFSSSPRKVFDEFRKMGVKVILTEEQLKSLEKSGIKEESYMKEQLEKIVMTKIHLGDIVEEEGVDIIDAYYDEVMALVSAILQDKLLKDADIKEYEGKIVIAFPDRGTFIGKVAKKLRYTASKYGKKTIRDLIKIIRNNLKDSLLYFPEQPMKINKKSVRPVLLDVELLVKSLSTREEEKAEQLINELIEFVKRIEPKKRGQLKAICNGLLASLEKTKEIIGTKIEGGEMEEEGEENVKERVEKEREEIFKEVDGWFDE